MITAMPRIAIAVRDFPAAVSTFREVFGMPVLDFSDRTVPELGAHVGMCVPEGGSNVELMAPANPDLPLSQALGRTLERRGEGLYALMLEAPDPDAEAESVAARGIEVMPLMAGAAGRDIHPRSTHGVLIRIYPDNSVPPPDERHSADPHLSGIASVIVATADAAAAADAFGRGVGLDVGPVERDEERGVLRAVCTPPRGGVIELVSVVDPSKAFAQEIDAFRRERKDGMYALVLRAEDPKAAVATLIERGASAGRSDLEVSVFGTRIVVE